MAKSLGYYWTTCEIGHTIHEDELYDYELVKRTWWEWVLRREIKYAQVVLVIDDRRPEITE